jgi:hypothetical protein
MKKALAALTGAAVLSTGGVALATAHAPLAHAIFGVCANAEDVQYGGGAGPMGANGGGWADCHFAPDGSHDHCVVVKVLGFGGMQCTRMGP